MSGQYKIQSNSKDDFSDLKAAHNIAKRGGFWNNIKSCISLIILLAICGFISSLMTGNVYAQASCFQRSHLHTTSPVEIRSSDSYFSRTLGKTTINKNYRVFESKPALLFGSCWLRTKDGWLLRRSTDSTIKVGRLVKQATLTPTTTTSDTCYTSSKAYITGSMNIRSTPSVSGNKVASANTGESFAVIRSQRGEDYCWLRISKGWIAKTGRVQSTKPVVRAVQPSSSAAYCPPVVEGSASFKSTMKQACNKIHRSSKWRGYFSGSRPASIGELTSHSYKGAKFSRSERQIEVNPYYGGTHDITLVASLLIHEACHIYQMDQGRSSSERECYQTQIDYVTSTAPSRSDLLSQLRRFLAQQ